MSVKEETPSHWCLSSKRASTNLGTALQMTRVQYVRYVRFVNKKQEGLVAGVCWCSMTAAKLSADSIDEEKKSPVKAGNDSFWKWSWLTGPSIRRCFPKEATMLRGSSQYTLRYHLTAMYREVVIREKHSRIIVFPLGFREVFSLLPCLYGSTCPNRESNTCKVDVWSAFRTDCCCL